MGSERVPDFMIAESIRRMVDLPRQAGARGKVALKRVGKRLVGSCSSCHRGARDAPVFQIDGAHYLCSACGESGDALAWVMDRLGVTNHGFMLQQQNINVQKLVASVQRLGLKLNTIPIDTYWRLIPLIHGGRNASARLVEHLRGGTYNSHAKSRAGPTFASTDRERLFAIVDREWAPLDLAEEQYLGIYDYMRLSFHDAYGRLPDCRTNL
jgi:hypothetical protein